MADGARINLIPCIAVVGSIIWRWVIFPLPISGMGPGIGMAGRVGAAGGGDTAIKVNSARGSMAVLAEGQIVFCIRSVQTSGGEWKLMGRTYTTGMTAGCDAVCIGEISGEATRRTRQWAGTGTYGVVAESATGVLCILGNTLVRRVIGGIRIVVCPLPVGGVSFGRRVTGEGGTVP